MALAHECGTSTCSPSSSFIISKAKYLLNLKEYVKAEETLMELTKKDIQVYLHVFCTFCMLVTTKWRLCTYMYVYRFLSAR